MQKELNIEIDDFVFNVIYSESQNRGLPILLLHGFTGNARDLSFLAEYIPADFIIVSPDLPGHGKSKPIELTENYTIDAIIEKLNLLIKILEFEKTAILGYSMGGRIAYSFAAKYPQSVSALIIESSTPGIADKKEREERRKYDYALAEKIQHEGLCKFVEFWLSQPLFSSLKEIDKRLYEKIRLEKLSNNPLGLVNSLRYTGTGSMQPVWDKLQSFQFPVLLINGSLDKKYAEINKLASAEIRNSKVIEIPNAGHNTHLENPGMFVNSIIDFLRESVK